MEPTPPQGLPHAFVIGRFPPPVDGQAVATRRLAELLEGSHTVERLNTSPPEGYAQAGSAVRFRPARVLHYLRRTADLHRALDRHPAAPVLWASVSPSLLGHYRDLLTVAPLLAKRTGVHAVVHHGDFDQLFRRPSTARSARWLVRHLSTVVFLTETLAERCAPYLAPEQRVVIPNTIGQDLVCSADELAAKREQRRGRDGLRLLFLSNMIPEKGYLDVLTAVAQLHRQGLPVHADFVGRWAGERDAEAFGRTVERAGLGAFVTHHGGVADRNRIKALYLRADAFLLPTYYSTEAQPLTVIEAMNAGTPVIVTAHAGLPEMVTEGVEGHFVPARDPEAVAAAVRRLLDRGHWRRLSEGARARFERAYSPDVVRDHWERLLVRG